MEWNQLKYFQVVAQLQQFTLSAEQLFISQPALSRSIAKLEEELGVPLFERRGKKIFLNRYGQIFLKHVNLAMQEMIEGKQEIQDLLDPNRGMISLAFLNALGTHLVPDIISKFRSEYPDVQFKLYQNSTIQMLEQLESGKIDFCLFGPIVTRERFAWVQLFSEELGVIVPSDHLLASRHIIQLTEIADEPIITFRKETGFRILTELLFKEVGATPHIAFEVDSFVTLVGMVEAKLGIALVPNLTGLEKTQLSFLRISEPEPIHRCITGMAWVNSRCLSPSAIVFRDFVVNYFQRNCFSSAFSSIYSLGSAPSTVQNETILPQHDA